MSHRFLKLRKIGTRTELSHQFSNIGIVTHTEAGFFLGYHFDLQGGPSLFDRLIDQTVSNFLPESV